MEVRNKVRAIVHDLNVAKVTVLGVPDRPGIATAIFEPLAEANVSVDTIVQNASVDRVTDLTFTVAKSDLDKAMKVVEPVAKSIGARGCVADSKLGKVSIAVGYAGGDMPRALTIEEIEELVEAWATAARRSKLAGFDAVEIHCAHGYLGSEFLSSRTNKRTDRYGGNLDGRARFPIEIISSGIKEGKKLFGVLTEK